MRKLDDEGREQWYFTDRRQFLTFGADSGLAAAVANYAWHVPDPPDAFGPGAPAGDMSPLAEWLDIGGVPSSDVMVMAAISMSDSGG